MGAPAMSRPTRSMGNTTPPDNRAQGVLIDMDTNLGRGIAAELSQDYKEAVKLLTRAIEEEQGEAIKVALARRFRGLAYKHLGRRDEALNDFREVIRIQPKLDVGYYDAGVIYNLTNRYQEAVELASRACQLDKWKDADQIDTLAAAHAEAGNFAEAERYQLKALSLLSADEALRPKFQARLKQYRAKQPVRQEIGQG